MRSSMSRFHRFHIPEAIYFVTSKTHLNRKLFKDEKNAQILLNCIDNLRKEGRYLLLAFVIMPDHLHILLRPDGEQEISKIMHSIKRGSSRLINQMWSRKGPVWQRRFYERIIRDEKEFWEKVNYIYNNPVKAGLVESPEDYPYSSANPKIETDLERFVSP
jgi:putative transposase